MTIDGTYFCDFRMVRQYKRQPGSRKYVDYSKAHLEAALRARRSKVMTQREAEAHFNIARSTLKNKL